VIADSLDEADPSCETVDRAGAGPPPPDTAPPNLSVSGLSAQRALRSRRVSVVAVSDEVATVRAAGALAIPGLRRRFKLTAAPKRIAVAGGGVEFALRLPRAALAPLRRALAKRRRVVAQVRVEATDEAGNRSPAHRLRIVLRR
jgi:hypothetical protein